MPEVDVINMSKTTRLPMRPIMKDESTNSNNIFIIDDLHTKQFQLGEGHSTFATQLRLVYGDLKTVKRMLAVKKIRSSTAEGAYDSYQWLIPGLGLWHLRFNLLRLIHRIHWGGGHPKDLSTLQYAADRWGRSRVVEPNDFQALEDLIIHSYQARVVGVWLKHAKRGGFDGSRLENALEWIQLQSQSSWKSLLSVVDRDLHPTTSTTADLETVDEEHLNHQHYCSHVGTYLLLTHAIKHADIGLLRRAIRECAVMFQAPTSRAANYARELLRQIHLTDSGAASPELQRAVLINGLVNLHGRRGCSFETDRLLELLNNTLKHFQKERSSFSKESDSLLEQWALNGPYLENLKSKVEQVLGLRSSARHPRKEAGEEIFNLARELSITSLRRARSERFSFFRTTSLFTGGLERLGSNILQYNAIDPGAAALDPDTAAPDLINTDPAETHTSTQGSGSPIIDTSDLLIA